MLVYEYIHKAFRKLNYQDIRGVFLQNGRIPILLRDHRNGIKVLAEEESHDVAEGIPIDHYVSGVPARIHISDDSVNIPSTGYP